MWASDPNAPFGLGHQHALLTLGTALYRKVQLLHDGLRIESHDHFVADLKGGHTVHAQLSVFLHVLQTGIDIFFDEGDPFTPQEILGGRAVRSCLRTI